MCAGTLRCLACRRTMQPSGTQSGLCPDCLPQEDVRAALLATLLQHQVLPLPRCIMGEHCTRMMSLPQHGCAHTGRGSQLLCIPTLCSCGHGVEK